MHLKERHGIARVAKADWSCEPPRRGESHRVGRAGCVAGVGGQTLTSRRLFRGNKNILVLEVAGLGRTRLGGQAAWPEWEARHSLVE